MKIYKYIAKVYLLIGVFLLQACSDYLDVPSRSTQDSGSFYQTEGQIDQALNGVYNGLIPVSLYWYILSEVRSDNTYVELNTNGQRDYSDIGAFRTTIVNIGTLSNAWNDYYKIVSNANALLAKIENVDFTYDGIKEQYIAEARFLRAFAYFDLVRFWGRVPLILEEISAAEALETGQSEAAEIYEKAIIPDLLFAIQNLNQSPKNYLNKDMVGKATQVAAKALLGRVYLTMAGFPLNDTSKKESARTLLKEVIDYADQSGKYWASDLDTWKRMWIHENNNKHHIFEIQYTNDLGSQLGNRMVFESCPGLSTAYTNVRIFGNSIWAEDGLVAEYKKEYNGSEDGRFLATIEPEKFEYDIEGTWYTGDDFFIKFLEHKMKRAELGYDDKDLEFGSTTNYNDWPLDFPLIRLEDVMLMYAEIVGPTAEGVNLVNKIRNRAGAEPVTATSEAEFLNIVLNERRLELASEGIRWHDLVRHNIYVETLQDMFKRKAYNEETGLTNNEIARYADNVDKNAYLYPIPENQMKVKGGLYTQNPGY